MRLRRFPVVLILTLMPCLVLSCTRDAPPPSDEASGTAAVPADSAAEAMMGWEPEGDYWKAYRAVLVIASCDSAGVVDSTELLYSYASPAESDSALHLVSEMHFDPEGYAGRIREDGIAPKRPGGPRFIVPVPTHGGAVPPPDIPSREELERAGLGFWLAICDELLPGWPFETWVVTNAVELRPCHPDRVVEDAKLRAAGLVSLSPDKMWAVHPFNSVQFTEDGRVGFDVDGGIVLYETASPHAARDYMTGPGAWFLSAEWIDRERFTVPVISEVGVSIDGKWVGFRAPELWGGHVDSSTVTVLLGPPIPPGETAAAWTRLRKLQTERYPGLRRSLRY
jgi:hypothetical protein